MQTNQATHTTHASGSLVSQGFRFILRGVEAKYVKPHDVRDDDVDCTDMGDVEFEAAFNASTVRMLLAALIELTSWQTTAPESVMVQARAAIARATGATP